VFGVAAASRNTRFQAAGYDHTWAGLAPADRASFCWRLLSSDLHRGLEAFWTFLERCGLFSGAQCPFRPKCPDGLLFGSRSKTAEGAVHMHRPSRSFTLEFSTGKPANRMYQLRNIA
jgi:hypothetical protein